MALTGRYERITAAVLAFVAVLTVVGGVVVLSGGSDPSSETGRLGHPGAAGVALLCVGVLCAGAAVLVRQRHQLAVPATIGAAVATGAVAAFRLWRFGVIGIGDLLIPTLLATLLVRSRPKGNASST